MVEVGDERGDGALEVDVVLPESVVGVEEEGLAGGSCAGCEARTWVDYRSDTDELLADVDADGWGSGSDYIAAGEAVGGDQVFDGGDEVVLAAGGAVAPGEVVGAELVFGLAVVDDGGGRRVAEGGGLLAGEGVADDVDVVREGEGWGEAVGEGVEDGHLGVGEDAVVRGCAGEDSVGGLIEEGGHGGGEAEAAELWEG